MEGNSGRRMLFFTEPRAARPKCPLRLRLALTHNPFYDTP
jgi:hypothetical protein